MSRAGERLVFVRRPLSEIPFDPHGLEECDALCGELASFVCLPLPANPICEFLVFLPDSWHIAVAVEGLVGTELSKALEPQSLVGIPHEAFGLEECDAFCGELASFVFCPLVRNPVCEFRIFRPSTGHIAVAVEGLVGTELVEALPPSVGSLIKEPIDTDRPDRLLQLGSVDCDDAVFLLVFVVWLGTTPATALFADLDREQVVLLTECLEHITDQLEVRPGECSFESFVSALLDVNRQDYVAEG